jgi:hypothetical protein
LPPAVLDSFRIVQCLAIAPCCLPIAILINGCTLLLLAVLLAGAESASLGGRKPSGGPIEGPRHQGMLQNHGTILPPWAFRNEGDPTQRAPLLGFPTPWEVVWFGRIGVGSSGHSFLAMDSSLRNFGIVEFRRCLWTPCLLWF